MKCPTFQWSVFAFAIVAVTGFAAEKNIANLRTISIGTSIEHKERIKTTSLGSVQLLFLDKTSMTIGPNSDLVIDDFSEMIEIDGTPLVRRNVLDRVARYRHARRIGSMGRIGN